MKVQLMKLIQVKKGLKIISTSAKKFKMGENNGIAVKDDYYEQANENDGIDSFKYL